MKPANQCGFVILGSKTRGLSAGITSGKAAFNSFDKSLFIDALIPTNLNRPYKFKCSLLLIKSIACLKS